MKSSASSSRLDVFCVQRWYFADPCLEGVVISAPVTFLSSRQQMAKFMWTWMNGCLCICLRWTTVCFDQTLLRCLFYFTSPQISEAESGLTDVLGPVYISHKNKSWLIRLQINNCVQLFTPGSKVHLQLITVHAKENVVKHKLWCQLSNKQNISKCVDVTNAWTQCWIVLCFFCFFVFIYVAQSPELRFC